MVYFEPEIEFTLTIASVSESLDFSLLEVLDEIDTDEMEDELESTTKELMPDKELLLAIELTAFGEELVIDELCADDDCDEVLVVWLLCFE